MMRTRMLALLSMAAMWTAAAPLARGQPRPQTHQQEIRSSAQAAEILRRARAAMEVGEHQRAADLALLLIRAAEDPRSELDRHDHAESWRIYGLALFFMGRYHGAEIAFLEYLKIDTEGRLDPALVPPEVVSFFEEVRARHAAELRRYRPRPEDKRVWALNLLPPAGQFQNDQPTKGWIIAGSGAALLTAHVSTFLVLRSWCDTGTGVCASGGESRTSSARLLRSINLISGALLLGVVTYGIADGIVHYDDRPRSVSVSVMPWHNSATLMVRGHY